MASSCNDFTVRSTTIFLRSVSNVSFASTGHGEKSILVIPSFELINRQVLPEDRFKKLKGFVSFPILDKQDQFYYCFDSLNILHF